MAYHEVTFPEKLGKAIGRYYQSDRFETIVDHLASREDEDQETVLEEFAGVTLRVDYYKGDIRGDIERVDGVGLHADD